MLVDGRDRHRRVLEEAHEAHFGGALRVGAAVAGAVEDERARGAGRAVGAEGDLVEQPRRNGAAAAGLEVDVEDLGLHVAGNRRQRGEQRRTLARHDVVELKAAGADLREIMVEPIGQGGVEIADVAVALGREEAGRSMVEIIDRVLEFLKDVLVPLELARDVGERPDRDAGLALAVAERAHADAQPAAGLALVGTDAHLLLAAAAFARRLEQAIDRFRNPGIADEDPLDRRHVVRLGGLDQGEVGAIGIDDAAAGVGDQDAFAGIVDHGLEQGARGLSAGNAQDPGGEREQQKDADHGEKREQRQDVRLGVGAADEQQGLRRHRPGSARSAAPVRCCRRHGRRGCGRSGHGRCRRPIAAAS